MTSLATLPISKLKKFNGIIKSLDVQYKKHIFLGDIIEALINSGYDEEEARMIFKKSVENGFIIHCCGYYYYWHDDTWMKS